ncbi:MAG: class I SAM-dependent methyltransferase [Cyanobacteria bacterium K_DeepCast_35m_m2_023]|nr:class I SAM-dependent methyltransferase [Cyanobacteria bacterium K_DeepCast_35m_m2_023]
MRMMDPSAGHNAEMTQSMKKHAFGYFEPIKKPTIESLQSFYAEQYFQLSLGGYRAIYSDEELLYIETKIRQKRLFIEDLLGRRHGVLLDVGCGEGFSLSHFQRSGWSVDGLDYSLAGVKAMNPHCERFVSTGDVSTLLEERLQSSLRYDAVLLTNVLEHVIDPPELLRRLRCLLVPGGIAVVTVPNDFSALQQHLLDNGSVSGPYWIALPDHLAYFNKDSLVATCEATGWHCIDVLADFPIDWYLLHSGSNYIRDRGLGREAHGARIAIENLLGQHSFQKLRAFYSAMADVGMGRDITAYLTLNQK